MEEPAIVKMRQEFAKPHAKQALNDACKALGGRWDAERKAWYVPAGLVLTQFLAKWGTRHDLTALCVA